MLEDPSRADTSQSESKFVSSENYFPVFEHNSSDLKLLEALVVTNITEFYTYMKATRDSHRRLALVADNVEGWRIAVVNMVFMLFLGYESARNAVDDLIEFQPTRTENAIVILLTELKCYSFLISQFRNEGDLRYRRLKLREEQYKTVIGALYSEVMEPHGDNQLYWRTAREMIPELKTRYQEAFGEELKV